MKPYFPLFGIMALLLLMILFASSFSASVIPGWHTTVYPKYVVWTFVLIMSLVFLTTGYWLKLKKAGRTIWILFGIHFVTTATAFAFIVFPFVFLNLFEENQEKLYRYTLLQIQLVPWAEFLFALCQTLFPIYFVKALK